MRLSSSCPVSTSLIQHECSRECSRDFTAASLLMYCLYLALIHFTKYILVPDCCGFNAECPQPGPLHEGFVPQIMLKGTVTGVWWGTVGLGGRAWGHGGYYLLPGHQVSLPSRVLCLSPRASCQIHSLGHTMWTLNPQDCELNKPLLLACTAYLGHFTAVRQN